MIPRAMLKAYRKDITAELRDGGGVLRRKELLENKYKVKNEWILWAVLNYHKKRSSL